MINIFSSNPTGKCRKRSNLQTLTTTCDQVEATIDDIEQKLHTLHSCSKEPLAKEFVIYLILQKFGDPQLCSPIGHVEVQ